jgi:hypothetical protein
MASEILPVPEQNLKEVIEIIRLGLKHHKKTTKSVSKNLKIWCKEEENYLKRLQ